MKLICCTSNSAGEKKRRGCRLPRMLRSILNAHEGMGIASSRHKRGCAFCWGGKRFSNEEDVYAPSHSKSTKKRPPMTLEAPSSPTRGGSDYECPPTPSLDQVNRVTLSDGSETRESLSNPERLLKIIKCFPFPTPKNSPKQSPRLARKSDDDGKENEGEEPFNQSFSASFVDAMEKLCQVSVETMAITALPLDCWLKERLKKFVQLSGHEGSIVPATNHTLYKKEAANRNEGRAYKAISEDKCLDGMTPRFVQEKESKETPDEWFIEIEDLLSSFTDPTKTAIMDIKIGTRTFLESEVSNCKKRADLYEKMIAIDPSEPSEAERAEAAITKLRYMQFRERESSSAQLGFRIEAAKMPGGTLHKNFKKVKTCEQVAATLAEFLGEEGSVRRKVLDRLEEMRRAVENSTFFAGHEVVGSSLLIMYDDHKVGVWMIDFAKATPIPEKLGALSHRAEWQPGNHEDGYLVGIDNLIQILSSCSEEESR